MITKKISSSFFLALLFLIFFTLGYTNNAKALSCPTLTFGESCGAGNGYCYTGTCEDEEGEEGHACGTKGGVCSNDCVGPDKELDGSERGCFGPLVCCLDKKSPHGSVCANIADATHINNEGWCYNDIYHSEDSGLEGESCGNEPGAFCYDGNVLSPCGLESETGLKTDLGGRSCDGGFGNGLYCCYDPDNPEGPSGGGGGTEFDFSALKTPYVTCAAREDEGITDGFPLFNGAIVPCGRKCDNPNTGADWTDQNEMDDCTICHFIIMGKRIYDFILAILIIVAILFITVGGVMYMTSGGNPSLVGLAKNIITKTLFGFALFICSWLIVFIILKMLSYNTDFLGVGDDWNEFTCEAVGPLQSEYDL